MSAALTESLIVTVAGVGFEAACAVGALYLCGALDMVAQLAQQIRRAVVMARLRFRRATVRGRMIGRRLA